MMTRYLVTAAAVLLLGACASGGDKQMAEAGATVCEDPRPQVCTADYRPVCGTLSDGGSKTYSNGCNACADANVTSWVEGECPE